MKKFWTLFFILVCGASDSVHAIDIILFNLIEGEKPQHVVVKAKYYGTFPDDPLKTEREVKSYTFSFREAIASFEEVGYKITMGDLWTNIEADAMIQAHAYRHPEFDTQFSQMPNTDDVEVLIGSSLQNGMAYAKAIWRAFPTITRLEFKVAALFEGSPPISLVQDLSLYENEAQIRLTKDAAGYHVLLSGWKDYNRHAVNTFTDRINSPLL